MLKNLVKIIKKIFFSILLIYGFNIIAQPININIPINIYTIVIITLLGVPSFLALIIIYLIVY